MKKPSFAKYASLPTEQVNPRTGDLDRIPVAKVIGKLNAEDKMVPDAVGRVIPAIARAVKIISAA